MQKTLAIDKRLRFYVLPLLLLVITVLMAASLHFRLRLVRQHSLDVATEGVRDIFHMVVLSRQWNAEHGGVYVFESEASPVNPYLDHPLKQLETTDKRKLILLNPAYMTREMAEIAAKDSDLRIRLHITSLKPIRPENKADPWETLALQRFEQGIQEVVSVEVEAGKDFLRYMAPLMVKPACLTCHAKQGYQLGDVRGGISVSLKLDSVEKTLQQDIQASIISHGISYGLLVIISCGLVELLARRWRTLDDTIETLQLTRNELLETEKMASLGRLVAGFAHEINTPVGVAVGAVSHGDEAISVLRDLFRQEEVSEQALNQQLDDLSESHQLALGNLRRAAELVQRFKRTSIDQSSHEQRQYQLEEVFQDVLTTLRNTLKHTRIDVALDCPSELKVFGTPGLLGQVLTNLIINSINHGFDHGKKPGQIRINVLQLNPKMVCIDYFDDGAGMTEQVRNKAFEPFFTTSRALGGTGLGLYVIYNIITQQMAGKIHIQSAPGAGVHFHIEFPIDTRMSDSSL